MAVRNIVKIDENKCNGCGLCVTSCAEGAIQIIDGKARLVSEVYCDGLGACLGTCPMDAITIEKRDAAEFDEQAVAKHLQQDQPKPAPRSEGFTCPGSMAKKLRPKTNDNEKNNSGDVSSQLQQWPVQLMLVSPQAPYFKNADILLVADCVPFAMGDFHQKFLKDHALAVGCPKLDDTKVYVEKLTEIIQVAQPKSLTVLHMEVPCCSGLNRIAQMALAASGVDTQFDDITITLEGEIRQ